MIDRQYQLFVTTMLLSTTARSVLRVATTTAGRQTAFKALAGSGCSVFRPFVDAKSSSWSCGCVKPDDASAYQSFSLLGQRRFKSSSTTTVDALATAQEGREAYQISQKVQGTDACLRVGLDKLGITNPSTLYRNLSYPELLEHEIANKEGTLAQAEYGPTFAVDTGKYTGRSPKDRFIVLNPGSETAENIDWNDINQPTTPEVYKELYEKAVAHFNTLDKAYVGDVYCGASPDTRKKVRFVHEMAWQQHFVTNMFIRPETTAELDNFEPDFTVINCCSQIDQDWKKHNLHSETAGVFNVEEKTAVIFGTWYGGENKKGIFSLMNYWLPMKGHFPMHCSANVGKDGDVALFFGLSGTGKTTLSAYPERALIGDDEHGWDDQGVFNFEGGCYAKTINLSEETEPDIYRAISTDALLENVMLRPEIGRASCRERV